MHLAISSKWKNCELLQPSTLGNANRTSRRKATKNHHRHEISKLYIDSHRFIVPYSSRPYFVTLRWYWALHHSATPCPTAKWHLPNSKQQMRANQSWWKNMERYGKTRKDTESIQTKFCGLKLHLCVSVNVEIGSETVPTVGHSDKHPSGPSSSAKVIVLCLRLIGRLASPTNLDVA